MYSLKKNYFVIILMKVCYNYKCLGLTAKFNLVRQFLDNDFSKIISY